MRNYFSLSSAFSKVKKLTNIFKGFVATFKALLHCCIIMPGCKLTREYPNMESSIEIRHFGSFWALFDVNISCKFLIDAMKYFDLGLWRYFLSAGMEKGVKYSQDQLSIMLLFEHKA